MNKNKNERHIVHPFSPVIDNNSRCLILGSVPSVRSLEEGFYYMHPNNRFWRILGDFCGEDLLRLNAEGKRAALLKNGIALYDAVKECDINGSSDSSVKNIVPADIVGLIKDAPVKKILCNGALSYSIAAKYNPQLKSVMVKMPSTSPLNAAFSFSRLLKSWKEELAAVF